MSVTIKIPWFLQPGTDGIKVVEVSGNTVGECLQMLVELFPTIKAEMFDKNGRLSPFIDILINGKSAYSEGLDKPVQDGDVLAPILIVGGG